MEGARVKTRETVSREVTRRWNLFSGAVVVVLGASMLAVLGTDFWLTGREMDRFVQSEQKSRAQSIAGFLARAAFVPAALGDVQGLQELVEGQAQTPDLTRAAVSDSAGRAVASIRSTEPAETLAVVEETKEIASPSGDGRVEGWVTVTLSLSRVQKLARASFSQTAKVTALLFLVALAVDVALILGMTRHFRELVGEAKLSEELRRSNQELEQFAFVASHDLQEPLRKVVSYCQLLERRAAEGLGEEGRQYARVAADGAKRMSDLIRDLLAFSRVGTQGRPFAVVEGEKLLDAALDALHEALKESGAKIRREPLPRVVGDPVQLAQVFQNLIANALKFHRDGERPEVTVSAAAEKGFWRFTVADNGIGIGPEYQDRIFEMFKRLNTKRQYPGTGIGLAICQKIVQRHGGRIWVESEPDKGSKFHFTLPAAGGKR
jgi:signal transduction histidine kinase